jgi:glutathione S-transferase
VLPDLFARLHPTDRSYFRQSREARFGRPLEEAALEPTQGLRELRTALTPVRAVLGEQHFLGGGQPSFADYIVFGALQWARAVCPLPLIEASDPVFAWRTRLLEAFDGYAANAVPAAGA